MIVFVVVYGVFDVCSFRVRVRRLGEDVRRVFEEWCGWRFVSVCGGGVVEELM